MSTNCEHERALKSRVSNAKFGLALESVQRSRQWLHARLQTEEQFEALSSMLGSYVCFGVRRKPPRAANNFKVAPLRATDAASWMRDRVVGPCID